ncbi:hypothetical protein I547_0891 [Mycobacterium kansasii 824]|nr:hypothetical protein I547_0891 [Mycobacterium kansasii 824]
MAIPNRLTTGSPPPHARRSKSRCSGPMTPTPGSNTAGVGVDLIAVDPDSCCDGS